MTIWRGLLGIVIAAAAASVLGACSESDDTTSTPAKDTGTKKEAGPLEASTVDSASTPDKKVSGSDALTATDLLLTDAGKLICDKQCVAKKPTTCVVVNGACVECSANLHCTSNPYALGSTCNTKNWCICASASDCTTSGFGASCDTARSVCACTANSDCGDNAFGPTCTASSSGRQYCACASDTDCAKNVHGTKCGKGASSKDFCGCLTQSDCASGKTCSLIYGVCM